MYNMSRVHLLAKSSPGSPRRKEREGTRPAVPDAMRGLCQRLACKLFGHRVDKLYPSEIKDIDKSCPCGVRILRENRFETRIRHNIACFFRGHRYLKLSERDAHAEYVCTQCGHPLLFEAAHSFYAQFQSFHKKVRYQCNLFGHRAHDVIERNGFSGVCLRPLRPLIPQAGEGNG